MSPNVVYAILFFEGLFTILLTSPAELVGNRVLKGFLDLLRIAILTAVALFTVHKYYSGIVEFSTFLSAASGGVIAWLVTFFVKYKIYARRALKRAEHVDSETCR